MAAFPDPPPLAFFVQAGGAAAVVFLVKAANRITRRPHYPHGR